MAELLKCPKCGSAMQADAAETRCPVCGTETGRTDDPSEFVTIAPSMSAVPARASSSALLPDEYATQLPHAPAGAEAATVAPGLVVSRTEPSATAAAVPRGFLPGY